MACGVVQMGHPFVYKSALLWMTPFLNFPRMDLSKILLTVCPGGTTAQYRQISFIVGGLITFLPPRIDPKSLIESLSSMAYHSLLFKIIYIYITLFVLTCINNALVYFVIDYC